MSFEKKKKKGYLIYLCVNNTNLSLKLVPVPLCLSSVLYGSNVFFFVLFLMCERVKPGVFYFISISHPVIYLVLPVAVDAAH